MRICLSWFFFLCEFLPQCCLLDCFGEKMNICFDLLSFLFCPLFFFLFDSCKSWSQTRNSFKPILLEKFLSWKVKCFFNWTWSSPFIGTSFSLWQFVFDDLYKLFMFWPSQLKISKPTITILDPAFFQLEKQSLSSSIFLCTSIPIIIVIWLPSCLTNETRSFEWSLLVLFVLIPQAPNDPTQHFDENTNKKHQFCFSLQTKLFRCEDIFVSKQEKILFHAMANAVNMQSPFFSFVCWKMIHFDAFFPFFMVLWLVQKRNKQQTHSTKTKLMLNELKKPPRKKECFLLVTQTNKNKVFENVYTIKHSTDKKKSTKKTDFETPNFNERKDTKFDYFVGNMKNKLFFSKGRICCFTQQQVWETRSVASPFPQKKEIVYWQIPFFTTLFLNEKTPNPTKNDELLSVPFFPSFLLRKKEACCAQRSFQILIQKNSMRRTLFFLELANTFEIRVSGRTSLKCWEKNWKSFRFFPHSQFKKILLNKKTKTTKNARENPPKDCQIKCWKRHIFAKTQKWHSIHHCHSNNLLWMAKIPDSGHTLSDTKKLDRFRTTQIPTTKLCLRVIFFVWKK